MGCRSRCLKGGQFCAQEFVRVGYYVNNEYPEEDVALREEPPKAPVIDKCAPPSCDAPAALGVWMHMP